MPYAGRGGAGNIEEASRQSDVTNKDLEANRQISDDTNIPSVSSDDQYAYSGRGGAGNFYRPAILDRLGIFSSTTAPSSTQSKVPSADSVQHASDVSSSTPTAKAPPPFAGRGGAGNWSASEERKQLEDESNGNFNHESGQELQDLSDKISKSVEEELPRPPKAHLDADIERSTDIWQGTNGGI